MNKFKVDFRPLLLLINIGFVLCLLLFGYLIFGDMLAPSFQADPIVQKSSSNSSRSSEDNYDKVVDGIHVQTGLIYAEGFEIVRATCTACHSAKLVTQNRATKEGWTQMIRWMQETQGLWDLGANESTIVNYLAKHYAPTEVGRRANLDVAAIEWYILEL
jgi:cytochrome c5